MEGNGKDIELGELKCMGGGEERECFFVGCKGIEGIA